MVFGLGKSKKKKKEAADAAAAASTAASAASSTSSPTKAKQQQQQQQQSPAARGSPVRASRGLKNSNNNNFADPNSESTRTLPTTNIQAVSPPRRPTVATPLKSSLRNAGSTPPPPARSSNVVTPPPSSPPMAYSNGANVRPSTTTTTPLTAGSTPPTTTTTGSALRAKPRYSTSGPIDVDDIPRSLVAATNISTASSGNTSSTFQTATTSKQVVQGQGQGQNNRGNNNRGSHRSSSSSKHRKKLAVDATPLAFEQAKKQEKQDKKQGKKQEQEEQVQPEQQEQQQVQEQQQGYNNVASTTQTQTHQLQVMHTTTMTTTMQMQHTHTRSAMLARQQQQAEQNEQEDNLSLQSGSRHSSRRGNNNNGNNDIDNLSLASSALSWDNGSAMSSRISVHIDHFLAEMAMADNAQLEQLAIQEMKHNQILPHKIKKLTAKINVLNEERDVLVGLIEQLTELVEQDKERKRAAKQKKKQQKKERKRRKRIERHRKKKKLAAAQAEAEAKKKEEEEEGVEQSASTPKTKTTAAALVTPDRTASKTGSSDHNNSDEEPYLEEAQVKGQDLAQKDNNNDDDVADVVAPDDPDEPWSPQYKPKPERKDDEDDDISVGALNSTIDTGDNNQDEEEEEEDDDEFAKLWNSSDNSGGFNSDDKNAPTTTTTDAAADSNTASQRILFEVGDPLNDPLFDDFYNDENNNAPKYNDDEDEHAKAKKAAKEEEDDLEVPAVRRRHFSTTNRRLPPKTKSFEQKAMEAKEGDWDVSEGLGSDGGERHDLIDKSSGHEEDDVNLDEKPKEEESQEEPPVAINGNDKDSGDIVVVAESADSNENDKEIVLTGSLWAKRKDRSDRFRAFNESDTYLPDHMPGSRGPSPTPSMKREAEQSSDDDSDSDSSDSDDSSAGGDDDQLLIDDDQNDAVPSGSHLLAKQLMSRLKQEEKLKEQEKLQRQLFELHNNSRHRKGNGTFSAGGMVQHRSASLTNIYSSKNNAMLSADYKSSSFHLTGTRRQTLANYREDSHPSLINDNSFSKLQSSFTATGQMGGGGGGGAITSDEVGELRQELLQCIHELEELKEERHFHEAKVRELLGVLERRFDVDEEAEEAGDDLDREVQKVIEEADIGADSYTLAGKKRKRIQSFLLQKVSQCAELAAEVEVLKEQLSAKQSKTEEAEGSNHISSKVEKPEEAQTPKPAALVSAISMSAGLTKDQVEKQLLEKSAECIDLQEQIKDLHKQLQEKDEAYQEVHRELFTANLALGVEVDRKATAQEALDEKCHDYDLLKEEFDKIKASLDQYEENSGELDKALMAKTAELNDMDKSYRDDVTIYKSQVEEKDAEISEMKEELNKLREKSEHLETQHLQLQEKAISKESEADELQKTLDIESDLKNELEKRCKSIEKEKLELAEDLARAKHESEINKALLQEGSSGAANSESGGIEIQKEVETLMTQNGEMSRELRTIKETEASLKSERERLVANATNMSIMLADSRAKVDFLQMQLEEYKSKEALSISEHGGALSRSAHGLPSMKAGDFRNFLSNSSSKLGSQFGSGSGMNGSLVMNDASERSTGGLGGSVRERNTRFRSFLNKRMGSQKGDLAGSSDDLNA